jgi:hypothetical protein
MGRRLLTPGADKKPGGAHAQGAAFAEEGSFCVRHLSFCVDCLDVLQTIYMRLDPYYRLTSSVITVLDKIRTTVTSKVMERME